MELEDNTIYWFIDGNDLLQLRGDLDDKLIKSMEKEIGPPYTFSLKTSQQSHLIGTASYIRRELSLEKLEAILKERDYKLVQVTPEKIKELSRGIEQSESETSQQT